MSNLGYFALGLGLLVVYLVAMAAALFGAAGTFAVLMFWAYLVLFAVLCVGVSAAVYLFSPDLVKERVWPGEGESDRVTVRALNVLMFAQLLLAGLDVGRLHWSAIVPFTVQILGLIGFAMGMALTNWAMLVNRFFSRGALEARPGPARRYVGTLLASAPSGLLRRAAVAAVHRPRAWLLARHCPDPSHRTVHGPTHLDRGAHARQCAPRLCELHAASPIPDRSGRLVRAHEWAAMLDPHIVRRTVHHCDGRKLRPTRSPQVRVSRAESGRLAKPLLPSLAATKAG